MLCAHGGSWLMLRTEGNLYKRARATRYMSIIFLMGFIVAGVWLLWVILTVIASQAI